MTGFALAMSAIDLSNICKGKPHTLICWLQAGKFAESAANGTWATAFARKKVFPTGTYIKGEGGRTTMLRWSGTANW